MQDKTPARITPALTYFKASLLAKLVRCAALPVCLAASSLSFAAPNQNFAAPSTSDNPLSQHSDWYGDVATNQNDYPSAASVVRNQEAATRAVANATAAATAGDTSNYNYRELNVQRKNINIPLPNPKFNYTASEKMALQGNGFNVIHETKIVPEVEDPLASPYYNPLTGKVEIPPEVQAEMDAEANLPIDPIEAMNMRLAEYDKELEQKIIQEQAERPFGDFIKVDEVYNQIPRTLDAFYVDRPQDARGLLEQINKIERTIDAELAFAVVGNKGIIALKNNTPFPNIGLTNFHLAYAVASLMGSRGDTVDEPIKFNINQLKRDIVSPLAETMFASVGTAAARKSGYDVELQNTKRGGQAKDARAKSKAIAEVVRKQRAGEEVAKPTGLRTIAAAQNSLFDDQQTLDELTKEGKLIEMTIGDLFNYSLGQADANASGVLLSYLGTLPSLEMFDRTKALQLTKFKYPDYQVAAYPDLGYENVSTMYEHAKLLALYEQDSNVPDEARDFIDEIMLFNVSSKDGIQKGIRNSVTKVGGVEENFELKLYSLEGVGGINSRGRRTVVSELALVEYKGLRFVLAIALRDIGGDRFKNEAQAENVISFTAKALFDYVINRPLNPNEVSLSPAVLKGQAPAGSANK